MEGFLGEVRMFGGNFAPRSWAFCEGQLLPISQNSALFSILGTTYGGDGRTTFALPDLRGRVPIGAGHGPGLSDRRLGAKGGTETVTLNISNLPSHNHSASLSFEPTPTTNNPNNAYFAGVSSSDGTASSFNNDTSATTAMAPDTFHATNNGGNIPTDIRQPYIAIYYIIAMYGIYPSRG
jgi:microcystin-dependent protein